MPRQLDQHRGVATASSGARVSAIAIEALVSVVEPLEI
jgi:hypothetical protein